MTSSRPHAQTDPTAVVGRRVLAAVIDSLLALALYVPILALGTYVFYERSPAPSTEAAQATCDRLNQAGPDSQPEQICLPIGDETVVVDIPALTAAVIRISAWSLVLAALNPVLLQGLTGATVGKFCVGLRVVRPDGAIAGIGREVLRWLLYLVEGGLIALVLVLVTRGHRRLGDMVAQTYVVPRRYVGAPIELPADPATAAPQPGPPPPSPDGPHWDPQRNTHILYDRPNEAWLRWNPQLHRWEPIDQ